MGWKKLRKMVSIPLQVFSLCSEIFRSFREPCRVPMGLVMAVLVGGMESVIWGPEEVGMMVITVVMPKLEQTVCFVLLRKDYDY